MNIPGAFTRTDVTFDKVAETVLALKPTAGYATLSFGVLPQGGATPSGIPNDAGPYTATANVDGTNRAISIAGTAAQTFTALVAGINTSISTWATATLVGGDIVITSLTTGIASTVVVTDTNLISNVKGANFGLLSNKSVKGTVEYLLWDKLDLAQQTQLATTMGVIDYNDTEWVHAADTVAFTGTGITQSSAMGIAAGTYRLNVACTGYSTSDVSFAVTAGMTFKQMLESAFLPALKALFPNTTAYLVQTNATTLTLFVESTIPGAAVTVTVTDGSVADATRLIFTVNATTTPDDWSAAVGAAVTGVNGSAGSVDVTGASAGYADVTVADTPAVTGATASAIAADTYSFKVATDGGALTNFTFVSAGNETLTALAALIDTAYTAGTVAFVTAPAPAFRFTSGTTGAASTVIVAAGEGVTDPDFFTTLAASLTATVAFATPVAGLTDASWKSRLTTATALTGDSVIRNMPTEAFLKKENKPAAKGLAVEAAIYHDGTNWRYFDTDVILSAT